MNPLDKSFANEYEIARRVGDRRFGSACPHERVKNGRCTNCLRRVVTSDRAVLLAVAEGLAEGIREAAREATKEQAMNKPDTLLEFAQAVARHLGHGWAAHPSDARDVQVVVDAPGDSGALYIRQDECRWCDSFRVRVTGRYPRYRSTPVLNSYNTEFPYITCAIKRGAEVVARDITQRFLPRYRPLVEKARELVMHYEQKNIAARQVAQDIAEIIGGADMHVDGGRLLETPVVSFSRRDGDGHAAMYGKVEVLGDAVNLSLSGAPVALAEQIAAAILRHYGGS